MNRDKLILGGILLAYLISRVINLGIIPIFTDEAIYLHWSQAMAQNWKYLSLPLTDGKPPLFMWLVAVVMKIWSGEDPLIVGRLTSVATGLLGVVGIYFSSYQLFRRSSVAMWAAVFYLIVPFTFFYDRFALADSLLAALATWSFGLGVVLVRNGSWWAAFILGITMGLGLLTKSPAQFLLFLLPCQLLVLVPERNWQRKIFKIGIQMVAAIILAKGIFTVLRIFPEAYIINLKNYEFIIPFSEFLRDPFRFFQGNIKALSLWEWQYLTPSVVGIVILSVILSRRKYWRQICLLVIYFLGPFAVMVFFNKVIYPRFLLTFTPMLLILGALGMTTVLERLNFLKTPRVIAMAILLVLVFYSPVTVDYKLWTDPAAALIADTDSAQYMNSWPAGYGVKETVVYLARENRRQRKITVGVEGTFGLMPYALYLYEKEYPNIEIKAYWPEPDKIPGDMLQAALDHATYYIVYQRVAPKDFPMLLVDKWREGYGRDYFQLYRVVPGKI